MAANLDRAETSLTAVSDVAYIRAIDSSGNSVRISKADLASVLGASRYEFRYYNTNSVAQAAGYPEWGQWHKLFFKTLDGRNEIEFCLKASTDNMLYIRELKRNGDTNYNFWRRVILESVS